MAGGVCGSIVGLSEKTVVLRVSDDPVVKMEFLRSAVSQVTSREGQAKE
jgi:preprotein translocase subunit YajC